MLTLKYYAAIEQAQLRTRANPPDAIPPFDLDKLGADSLRRRALMWLTGWLLPAALALFRTLWPNPKFGRLVIVTRATDVRDVLLRKDEFEVPYRLEMTELAGGENFVLGMEGPGHDEQNKHIQTAMPISDAQVVIDLSHRFANALIRTSGGRIDVMKDFITRIATETCADYFGLQLDDPDAFAEWTMSISALLFADPFGDATTRELALNGAARVRNIIDHSIANAAMVPPTCVLRRLIDLKATNPTLTDDKICAILVGLATGFIPTNTLAAGKILQELLRRPDLLRDAVAEARIASRVDGENRTATDKVANPHKQALQAILLEAARINPALAPGQWRYVKQDAVIAPGTSRERKVPQGSVLMVATMSALRDKSGDTKPDLNLMFGTGIHECLGKHLAIAQITEIFMILLSQVNLRFAEDTWGSRIRWVGPFPRRLDMTFDPAVSPTTQTMITVCAPIIVGRGDAPIKTAQQVKEQIAELKNPANNPMREMLDKTGIVHFASLSLIEAGDANEPAPHLLLELNVDGSSEAAFRSIAAADIDIAGGSLHSIFRNTPKGNAGLAEILSAYVLDLKARPWGAIGLNFNGTPEFSVPDIEMQEALSEFARRALNFYMSFHSGIGNRSMEALKFIRMFLHNPSRYEAVLQDPAQNYPELREMVDMAPKLADFLIIPSRRRLRISEWKDCSRNEAIFNFLQSWNYWSFALPVIAVAFLLGLTIFFATATGAIALVSLTGRIALAVIGGAAAVLALLAIVVAVFVALLRYHETHDVPDDQNPSLEHVREIAGVENPIGFAQNHFMAVTELKSGWFRKLTLAMSLWGIKQMVLFLFRPGFVLNMGTIHYAKWFRIPGRDKLIFQANYDGSWESYLEDFIMKAHQGQTAAWGNGVGFPRTRYLINEGAQDGDRFKRWVRRQQVLAPFWYSRFPRLTTDQIRINALIHDGLARASTDSAARAWLDCFASIPRPDYSIESDEVQSIVFRGQRSLPSSIYALIRLPDTKDDRIRWLEKLEYGSASAHGTNDLPKRDRSCEVTFGDHPFSGEPEQNLATFVAFSAAGLRKLGLADSTKHDGLGTFPNTFNLGMANRGRSLGDFGETSSAEWRWADAAVLSHDVGCCKGPTAVDAVLLIYASSPEVCRQVLGKHLELLGPGALVHEIPTQPPTERLGYDDEGRAVIKRLPHASDRAGHCPAGSDARTMVKPIAVEYEHFGFRDGISQPVIRGTQRFSKGARKRDIVEPGEFILGYRNNQGYYPPTATIRAESDWKRHLPIVIADVPSRFPSFEGSNAAARDFGRNGSFLVIRQLEQDVEGFKDFVEAKASELRDEYDGLSEAASAPITAQWVAAKMMGRWPDGTPLVDRPGEEHRHKDEQDNNFTFGADDPQGLLCPFGAHIRRANPRDSMQPDDPSQQSITNRHRVLRRGRTYEYKPEKDGKIEKGLLFTCLCADLDRQYEFVQQTWIQSPSFHGLKDEPDPMVAWPDPSKPRVFTIPTSTGPVRIRDMKSFVTVRAGGYFFLPSRSAIQYLVDINQP